MPMYVEKVQLGLNPRRLAVVEQAFQKLDRDGSGFIDAKEMRALYDVRRLPTVSNGVLAPSMAFDAFYRQFEDAANRDGRVSFDEFVTFYTKMSTEVDRGHELQKDAFFEAIVRKSWGLDEDEMPVLSQTGIIPITLELPKGMARAKGMDLVWLSPDGKGVMGYKNAVRTVFARQVIPEVLRGFFALYGELERVPVTYLPTKSAVLPPLDFAWPTDDGSWVGYQGVIASNVLLATLPEDLRALVKTSQESAALGVAYLTAAPVVANPNFVRSSDAYGKDVLPECDQLAMLKAATFNGSAAGTKYLGRTGKFTNKMPPPSPSAGLNCGTVKKAWGL